MSEKTRRIRCAVYTRKSHEEGLEQEFNSLDAQREAGESYVLAQRHEGWTLVPDYYDDGGFSGGSMERPALKRLLTDIERGLIDVVVVYKIDRLTRSLVDFSRIIDVFEKRGVSFVSVTQQFNTTTSMGRLILNVLLSFAQFEREVTGERIRDKLAASKRKGLWMGGVPPLGYDIVERKLIINEGEAGIVRFLFRRFTETGSITAVTLEARKAGCRSKTYITTKGNQREGKLLDKGAVYKLLHNRLYLGEISHKSASYKGQHQAIIDQPTWDAAHAVLAISPRTRANHNRREIPASLRGVLACGGCNSGMTATSTRRRGKLYRYYTPNNHIKKSCDDCPIGSISAGEIEGIVLQQLQPILKTPETLALLTREARKTNPAATEADVSHTLGNLAEIWEHVFPAEQERLMQRLIKRITVHPNRVDIDIQPEGVTVLVSILPITDENKEAA